ncbi:MAG: glutathione S-transferase [Betaproteobacteria bacterium]|nr:glutathione S-transferase [Betaproteobacteria bacterium]
MKLHWSPRSPYVRKVMIVAYEAGLVDRIERMRSVAAMRKPNPAIMRDNPLSKIPTLVLDDGRVLFDSAVICEYLDSLHARTPLFPKSGQTRWDALRWHALGDGLLDALILWRNEREREPGQRLQDLMEAFELKTRAALAVLDRETQPLEAAPFGIGHIAIVCALGYLDFRFAGFDWRSGHQQIAAWFDKQSQRPSVQNTAPVDDQ